MIITKQANLEQAQLVTATFGFTNSKKDTAFWKTTLTPLLKEIEADLTLEQIRELPNIIATKKAYKAVGLDAARHRPSSDSLLRRVVKGQGLYQINALVDVNNYLSLKLQLPIGSYDLAKIDGPISYQVAEEGAEYAGIGKGAINISHFPTLVDQQGAFGSPISDSTRAMIAPETTEAMIVVYAFGQSPAQLTAIEQTIKTVLQAAFNPEEIITEIIA